MIAVLLLNNKNNSAETSMSSIAALIGKSDILIEGGFRLTK